MSMVGSQVPYTIYTITCKLAMADDAFELYKKHDVGEISIGIYVKV